MLTFTPSSGLSRFTDLESSTKDWEMVSEEVEEVVGRTVMGERSQTNGVVLVHGTAGLLAVSC